MSQEKSPETNEKKYWKLGIFYFNPEDKRIFPPKRIPAMGWTVNFANPRSLLAMLILVALVIGILEVIKKL